MDGRTAYDASGDAERLARPMAEWARSGFLRGLAGVRAEVLPRGRMTLPSGAFMDAATAALRDGNPDAEEFERRLSYMDEVGERLRVAQSAHIEGHYRGAAWGRVCDFGIAVMVLVLVVGLVTRVGVYHPVTAVFLVLFAAKLAFMHLTARKLARRAREAFLCSAEIRMPWEGRGGA